MRNSFKVNTYQLNQELYYNPAWYRDRETFMSLLNKSSLTENDILKLARLYVKYDHTHNRKTNELNRYFLYMFNKLNIYSSRQFFEKTKKIYLERVSR